MDRSVNSQTTDKTYSLNFNIEFMFAGRSWFLLYWNLQNCKCKTYIIFALKIDDFFFNFKIFEFLYLNYRAVSTPKVFLFIIDVV